MSFKIGFTDGALHDLREAQVWYKKKIPGLGARFSEAEELQASALETMPEKYRVARVIYIYVLFLNSHLNFTIELKGSK